MGERKWELCTLPDIYRSSRKKSMIFFMLHTKLIILLSFVYIQEPLQKYFQLDQIA
jgi:hypothetical protein